MDSTKKLECFREVQVPTQSIDVDRGDERERERVTQGTPHQAIIQDRVGQERTLEGSYGPQRTAKD